MNIWLTTRHHTGKVRELHIKKVGRELSRNFWNFLSFSNCVVYRHSELKTSNKQRARTSTHKTGETMSNRFQLLEKEISAYCTAVARERERTQKIKMQVRLMENWVKSCIECQINLCATSCRRLQSSSDPTMICESHYYSTYNFSARIFSFRVVHS